MPDLQQKRKVIFTLLILVIFVGGIYTNQFYSEFKSKELYSCEDYSFNDDLHDKIFYLMKEKKYEEVISLGNKYLKDEGIWFCDNYFWEQRAQAFYSLGNCSQALRASLQTIYTSPTEANELAKEFYEFVGKSDICSTKNKFVPIEIVWAGKIDKVMTYGRLLFKNLDSEAEYKYFIAEPNDVIENGGSRYSSTTGNIQLTDTVKVTGVITHDEYKCWWNEPKYEGCVPWVAITKLEVVND